MIMWLQAKKKKKKSVMKTICSDGKQKMSHIFKISSYLQVIFLVFFFFLGFLAWKCYKYVSFIPDQFFIWSVGRGYQLEETQNLTDSHCGICNETHSLQSFKEWSIYDNSIMFKGTTVFHFTSVHILTRSSEPFKD